MILSSLITTVNETSNYLTFTVY